MHVSVRAVRVYVCVCACEYSCVYIHMHMQCTCIVYKCTCTDAHNRTICVGRSAMKQYLPKKKVSKSGFWQTATSLMLTFTLGEPLMESQLSVVWENG